MQHLGRTLAIVNPAARNGDGARGAAFLRYAANFDRAPFASLDIATTREPGHAALLAAEASGYDSIVVVGGDGVMHEVVGGLMTLPCERRPRMALLPCGNGNDYARTLGMSFKLEESFEQLIGACARQVDVGVCNGQPYMQTLSFGLDAAIALGTHERRRRTGHTGTRLFVEEGANQLLFHRDEYSYELVLDAEEEPRTGSMYMLALQIGPTYGGGFRVCPEADPSDGILDGCVVHPPMSAAHALIVFARAKNGHHVNAPACEFFNASHVHVSFNAAPPTQIDGELIEGSDFDVSVEHDALEVYFADGAGK